MTCVVRTVLALVASLLVLSASARAAEQVDLLLVLASDVSAIIRHRLDVEAKELQKIYSARHLNRNPRSDMFAVADFDGKAVSQLGVVPTSGKRS